MENNTVKFSLFRKMCSLLGVCLDRPADLDGGPTIAGRVEHSLVKSLGSESKEDQEVKFIPGCIAKLQTDGRSQGSKRPGGGGAAYTRGPFL